MPTDKKVKVYKNPARNRPETVKPYVPQYQLLGREPEEYRSPLAPGYKPGVVQTPQKNNPRDPRPAIRQPYAEAVTSPIGRGRGLLPNVGNNIEQTWSSVDGEFVIDDISEPVDPNQPSVDNNEFVSAAALGLPEETVEIGGESIDNLRKAVYAVEEEVFQEPQSFLTQDQLQEAINEDGLSGIIKELQEDDYLLLVSGHAVCSGPQEQVEEEARLLVFGEHEAYGGNPVSIDDIIVIKRTKIKVGVFLE